MAFLSDCRVSIVILVLALALIQCKADADNEADSGAGNGDADGDGDSDTGSDSVSNGETDSDTDRETGELIYTNVTEVAVSGSVNSYTFNVTLETADLDCAQFADWWEVLTEDGVLLYRRILAHPHTVELSGNPFTRSGSPVGIAADQVVIVRGHMNKAGYVGMALRGSAEGGFVHAPEIGSDFAPGVESETPQPVDCIPEEDVVGK